MSPTQLNLAIQIFSLISIFFEGYDQGVMGGVNAAPDYTKEVGLGPDPADVNSTVHQGGIISIYYLGCIVGCMFIVPFDACVTEGASSLTHSFRLCWWLGR